MATHQLWGEVADYSDGFGSETPMSIPVFDAELEIGLGPEDVGQEVYEEPSTAELDAMASCYRSFLGAVGEHYQLCMERAFERYQRLYASYYENDKRSGQPPLQLKTAEDHAPFLKLSGLRLHDAATIRLVFDYELDTEHGLEIVLRDGAFHAMGGIADVLR